MAGKYKILQMSKGNLTKKQQDAKLQAEFLAADGLAPLQVSPPNHLDPIAKNEYKRIIKSLGKLPLRNLDRGELELYCTWYSIYKRADLAMSAALAEDNQDDYYSYVGILNKATAAIKGLAGDLGLNVNSRMAMNMPKEPKETQSLTDMFG
ncbi:P27 family phage terminase small subunit [Schleiferilactobacillus harbinensis]|uniref:Terminase n=1 Tax=Schleiferilactobacillus harbinensis TaxID=304207 RepID=A0A5P8M3L8_9LACO|nr:P27 family phage terminase small subunit [Schleiferilactobacillus harbinensis]QFR23102.1 terminase [Schleiferilactobacillus harbinensis]